MMIKNRSYFIVGTDTGIGKTFITRLLMGHFIQQGHTVIGMKPIASGVDDNGLNADTAILQKASNVDVSIDEINCYCFREPIAPHLAARKSGIEIEISVIRERFLQLQKKADVVLVEGVGGVLVPLRVSQSAPHQTLLDLLASLDISIIVVVGMRLGCLNHALLTVSALRSRGLNIAGWVANEIDPQMLYLEENIADLKSLLGVPFLGCVKWGGVLEDNFLAKDL